VSPGLKITSPWIVLECVALAMLLPACARAQSSSDIGELFATETTAHGPVLLAGTGMSVAGGSQIAAGKSVATLRLTRGGELLLCPNTSLTVGAVDDTAPVRSQELMLSMDTGSLEFNYPINDLGDTLVTPDFKFMLAGPGVFHFALGVNSRGDTCIKPLRGNSASIIVSEMLGSGVYQVKSDEAVIFAGGKMSGRGKLDGECGCPVSPPVLEAKESAAAPTPEQPKSGEAARSSEARPEPAGSQMTSTLEKPAHSHMELEVPLVFRGDQPEPAYAVARIRFSSLPNMFLVPQKPLALKPGQQQISEKNKEKKGFFGRIKGFFAAIFH
jgi:hypothetical protein